MGILDDAIREHLELKRQHGAAEGELQELEDQAFGSPERPNAPQADDSYEEAPTEFMAQPEAVEEEHQVADEEEEHQAADEEHQAMEHQIPVLPDSGEGGHQSIADQPTEMYDVESEFAAGEDEAESEADESDDDEAVEDEEEFFDEKSLSDELDQALDAPAEGEEEAEEEAGHESQSDDSEEEDVLEETPEFLQDTPESERLWFEQKPPKDFDFDD